MEMKYAKYRKWMQEKGRMEQISPRQVTMHKVQTAFSPQLSNYEEVPANKHVNLSALIATQNKLHYRF